MGAFLGAVSNLETLLMTTLLTLFPYFFLLTMHLLQVMIAEVVKLTTMILMKVKKRIPEVLVKVTHME